MSKEETFEEFIEKLCEYTKEDYESDLKMIEVCESKGINKIYVDSLKWITSQYKPTKPTLNH
jgi:hypothetical protein